MFRRRALPLFSLVALSLGLGLPTAVAAKPAIPPSLTGESFSGTPIFSNVLCDPDGTSSFDYSVTGTASGPYPGTYTETGTVTISQQPIIRSDREIINLGQFLGVIDYFYGRATSIEADFTIESQAGTVTGHRTLSIPFGPNAACQNTVHWVSPVFGSTTPSATVRWARGAEAAYSAEIQSGRRTYCDNGSSALTVEVIAVDGIGTIVPANFSAGFTSGSETVSRVRGKQGC